MFAINIEVKNKAVHNIELPYYDCLLAAIKSTANLLKNSLSYRIRYLIQYIITSKIQN